MSVDPYEEEKRLRDDLHEMNKNKYRSTEQRLRKERAQQSTEFTEQSTASPGEKTPLGEAERSLSVSFTRNFQFDASNYDLIIVPYGAKGIIREFARNPLFKSKALVSAIEAATENYSVSHASIGAERSHSPAPILLFRAVESGKYFLEELTNTLAKLPILTETPFRIIDCMDYTGPGAYPIENHLSNLAKTVSGLPGPVSCEMCVTPSSSRFDTDEAVRLLLEHSNFALVSFTDFDGNTRDASPDDPDGASKKTFNTRSHLECDQPSPNDYLGFQPVADSVAAFVRHKATQLPLCLAIDGPWGSGKSSMMLMIQEALQENSTQTRRKLKAAPRLLGNLGQSLWLFYLTFEPLIILGAIGFIIWWYNTFPDAAEITFGGGTAIGAAVYLFLMLGTALLGARQRRRRHTSDRRHFETITINAWRYGDGVRLKAAIVQSIITELMERRGPRFLLRLQVSRLNRLSLLTSLSKSLFQSWLFTILAILVGLYLIMGSMAGEPTTVAASLAEVAGLKLPTGYGDSVLGLLVAILGVVAQIRKNGQIASVGDFIANPDYEGLVGPDEEVEEDFRRILHLLDEEGYTLALFIDDLDRCSPTAVHKVVEALNVFFGQPDCRCLFILGMHKEMVATALEVAYRDIADKMKNNSLLAEQRPFGRRFLEKVVQFVLHVPRPREEQVEIYLQHMTSGLTDADYRKIAEQEAEAKRPDHDRFARNIERIGSSLTRAWRRLIGLIGLGRPVESSQTPQRIDERVALIETDEEAKARLDAERERIARFEARLAEAANFTEGSDENIRMFTMVRPTLGSNPRQYKRYFNQLRFNRFITEDRLPESEEKSLRTDAIMAAIALECPEAYQWAYSGLSVGEDQRNIDAALGKLEQKAREALPANIKTLEDTGTMEEEVHVLLRTSAAFQSLLNPKGEGTTQAQTGAQA